MSVRDVTSHYGLDEALRALIVFIKAHRTAGDGDLEALVSRIESCLPAQDAR